jgi:hypothetical protein
MSRYIFSKEAEKDLIAIYRYGYFVYHSANYPDMGQPMTLILSFNKNASAM